MEHMVTFSLDPDTFLGYEFLKRWQKNNPKTQVFSIKNECQWQTKKLYSSDQSSGEPGKRGGTELPVKLIVIAGDCCIRPVGELPRSDFIDLRRF